MDIIKMIQNLNKQHNRFFFRPNKNERNIETKLSNFVAKLSERVANFLHTALYTFIALNKNQN